MKFAFVAAAFLTLVGCSKPIAPMSASGGRIVGGQEADYSEGFTRHVVAIGNAERTWCSGSIYNDKYIITAAHCVDRKVVAANPNDLRVYFGANVGDGTTAPTREVVSYRVAPGWYIYSNKTNRGADIALLRITGGLPDGFEGSEILSDASLLTNRTPIAYAGYGRTSVDAVDSFGLLRYVYTEVALHENDQISLDPNPVDPASYIHLDVKDGRAVSHGDSGGPAYALEGGIWKQWGVTGGGNETELIFASLPHRAEWIEETITKIEAELETDGELGASAIYAPLLWATVEIENPKIDGFCTGFLISKSKVITSAKCVPTKERYIDRTVISFVIHGTDESDVERKVTEQAVLRGFEPSENRETDINDHDLAILTFRGSLPSKYKPIKVVDEDMGYENGSLLDVVGYSLSRKDLVSQHNIVRMVETMLVNGAHSEGILQMDRWLGTDAFNGLGNGLFGYYDGEFALVGISTANRPEGSYFVELKRHLKFIKKHLKD